jgi:heptosyltransferase-2
MQTHSTQQPGQGQMTRKSLLIIQHGHGPHREINDSERINYSDIFRSTCLLEQFRGHHVTWITNMAAEDLFLENHLIDQLILADHPIQLPSETIHHYDVVINLESEPIWSRWARKLPAAHRYGFLRPDTFANPDSSSFQNTLYNLIGRPWTGQKYVLGYKPRGELIHDMGINQFVAPGLIHDPWEQKSWQSLYQRCRSEHDISWPRAIDGIREYIEWIASCRVIVTGQNLGLHLALALDKKVVLLRNRNDSDLVYLYGQGIKLASYCGPQNDPSFTETIPVNVVVEAVTNQIHNLSDVEQSELSDSVKSKLRV